MPGAMVAQALEPWSLTDLITSLRTVALRGARLIGGGGTATS
jgi:hypothetical protein